MPRMTFSKCCEISFNCLILHSKSLCTVSEFLSNSLLCLTIFRRVNTCSAHDLQTLRPGNSSLSLRSTIGISLFGNATDRTLSGIEVREVFSSDGFAMISILTTFSLVCL